MCGGEEINWSRVIKCTQKCWKRNPTFCRCLSPSAGCLHWLGGLPGHRQRMSVKCYFCQTDKEIRFLLSIPLIVAYFWLQCPVSHTSLIRLLILLLLLLLYVVLHGSDQRHVPYYNADKNGTLSRAVNGSRAIQCRLQRCLLETSQPPPPTSSAMHHLPLSLDLSATLPLTSRTLYLICLAEPFSDAIQV